MYVVVVHSVVGKKGEFVVDGSSAAEEALIYTVAHCREMNPYLIGRTKVLFCCGGLHAFSFVAAFGTFVERISSYILISQPRHEAAPASYRDGHQNM